VWSGDAGPPRLDDHEGRDKSAAECPHHVHDCLPESAVLKSYPSLTPAAIQACAASWELIHVAAAMLDLDPRDYDSRDDERHSHTPSRAVPAPATASAITTGDIPTRGRATAMTMIRGRSDVVLETTGKGQTSTDAIAIPIPADRPGSRRSRTRARRPGCIQPTCSPASRTRVRARSRPRSRVHVAPAPSPGRLQSSVHSEWSPVRPHDEGQGEPAHPVRSEWAASRPS
jgi:hypothetical protein